MKLKRLRLARGLTQMQLAKKLKMKQPHLAMLESGAKPNPSLETLRRLAKALKISVEALTDQCKERRKGMLSPEQILAKAEAVTGDTPNSEIEELIFQIQRMKREGFPVPSTDYDYRDNWDWVLFNIHRNLKKEIKDLRKEVLA